MRRAIHEIVSSGLSVLLVLAALGFTVSTFAEGTDYECDGTEDQCVTGSQDTAEGRYRKCMANGGDAKTCSQRTGYVGTQTVPGSTTNSSSDDCEGSGSINYDAYYAGFSGYLDGDLAQQHGVKDGDQCAGGKGVWRKIGASSNLKCLADADGDRIADSGDDCPNDPTNSDPDCLDDLVDCPFLLAAFFDIGSAVARQAAITSGTMVVSVTVSGVAVTTTVGVAAITAGVALTLGSIYCTAAYLEG